MIATNQISADRNQLAKVFQIVTNDFCLTKVKSLYENRKKIRTSPYTFPQSLRHLNGHVALKLELVGK